jgi:hypothetical protein
MQIKIMIVCSKAWNLRMSRQASLKIMRTKSLLSLLKKKKHTLKAKNLSKTYFKTPNKKIINSLIFFEMKTCLIFRNMKIMKTVKLSKMETKKMNKWISHLSKISQR